MLSYLGIPAAIVVLTAGSALGQTSISGYDMAMRSSGTRSVSTQTATLSQNGFVGTYVTLAQPGQVTLALNAFGSTSDATAPRMNLVINDTSTGWNVGATPGTYSTSLTLPAGTHFIRTEFANDVPSASRSLTIQNLQVSGAAVSNSNSNVNALAAADTYIANYRKGSATVSLPGLVAETPVQVKLANHAFRFGAAVPGFSTASSVNALLGNNPAPGSNAANYQQRLLQNFNSVTPANAGKWDSNEATQNVVTMGGVDRIAQFAGDNGLRVRQHNLIWGNQQPNYINTLLTNAAAGNAAAKANLTSEVQQRIQYYVKDRATRYEHLDVYNESVHTPQYWNAYGAAGIADIYNQAAAAAQQGGGNVKLFTNEYNVLADSSLNGSADGFANWYRNHVEEIRNAGGNVGGVGIQYYAHEGLGTGNSLHNAARVYGALNNLSVGGLALELTEFGIKDNGSGTDAQNRATDAQVLRESMKLVFGSPASTGFTMWGFWAGDMWDQAPSAALYDSNWNLTPAGDAYRDLMTLDADADSSDDWSTELTAIVNPDGTINFNGFYGDYELLVNGRTYELTLEKGVSNYAVAVPEPGTLSVVAGVLFLLQHRRARRSVRATRHARRRRTATSNR